MQKHFSLINHVALRTLANKPSYSQQMDRRCFFKESNKPKKKDLETLTVGDSSNKQPIQSPYKRTCFHLENCFIEITQSLSTKSPSPGHEKEEGSSLPLSVSISEEENLNYFMSTSPSSVPKMLAELSKRNLEKISPFHQLQWEGKIHLVSQMYNRATVTAISAVSTEFIVSAL